MTKIRYAPKFQTEKSKIPKLNSYILSAVYRSVLCGGSTGNLEWIQNVKLSKLEIYNQEKEKPNAWINAWKSDVVVWNKKKRVIKTKSPQTWRLEI